MKIIAGEYGGRNIKTLDSYDTRPTSAKVRGAIFNALGQYFLGGVVLDLFAGSGAMAIEALSRGCIEADCVDNSKEACKLIKENRKALKLDSTLKVHQSDYLNYLNRTMKKYDLIFVDPPYKLEIMEILTQTIFQKELLKEDGRLILEFSNKMYKQEDLLFLEQYNVIFDRSYDVTHVVIIENQTTD